MVLSWYSAIVDQSCEWRHLTVPTHFCFQTSDRTVHIYVYSMYLMHCTDFFVDRLILWTHFYCRWLILPVLASAVLVWLQWLCSAKVIDVELVTQLLLVCQKTIEKLIFTHMNGCLDEASWKIISAIQFTTLVAELMQRKCVIFGSLFLFAVWGVSFIQ